MDKSLEINKDINKQSKTYIQTERTHELQKNEGTNEDTRNQYIEK